MTEDSTLPGPLSTSTSGSFSGGMQMQQRRALASQLDTNDFRNWRWQAQAADSPSRLWATTSQEPTAAATECNNTRSSEE
jgi:hypothetical protein